MKDRVKIPTGIKRLDELLGGGLDERTVTLVYGPPFIGKELLAKVFAREGIAQGVPGVFIVTDHSAHEVKTELAMLGADLDNEAKQDLCMFVDAYSKSIGLEDEVRNVHYVDGLVNLNGLSVGLNDVQRKLHMHERHLLVVDSVSTLIAYTNAQTTFRFLQILTGRAKSAGATTLLLLEEGMHSEADVKMMKHLADAFIELRSEKGNTLMRVEGAGLTTNPGWVEYRMTPRAIEVTGSFGAGRIK